jgi:hypothetical protein
MPSTNAALGTNPGAAGWFEMLRALLSLVGGERGCSCLQADQGLALSRAISLRKAGQDQGNLRRAIAAKRNLKHILPGYRGDTASMPKPNDADGRALTDREMKRLAVPDKGMRWFGADCG